MVDLPLWKLWVRQLGVLFHILWKIKHVPNTHQIWYSQTHTLSKASGWWRVSHDSQLNLQRQRSLHVHLHGENASPWASSENERPLIFPNNCHCCQVKCSHFQSVSGQFSKNGSEIAIFQNPIVEHHVLDEAEPLWGYPIVRQTQFPDTPTFYAAISTSSSRILRKALRS